MLKGITEKGELKNVKLSEEGEILVKMQTSQENPLPVKIIGDTPEVETTLQSTILNVGTEETSLEIGKKVTNIMVANYSETADVNVKLGESMVFKVGTKIATELPINAVIASIAISSTEEDVKVQLIVKGVM